MKKNFVELTLLAASMLLVRAISSLKGAAAVSSALKFIAPKIESSDRNEAATSLFRSPTFESGTASTRDAKQQHHA